VTWLKRNLIDVVMIGVILAVVGAFLAVLLRGGVNPRDNLSKPEVTQTIDAAKRAAAPAPTTPKASPLLSQTPETDLATPQIPVAPEAGSSARANPQTANVVTSKPVTKKAVTNVKKLAPNQPGAATTQPKRSGQHSRSEFLRNYRIAAGTYSSLARAERTAAALRQRGLPAQAFSSGKGYVVVVGPYAQETSARAALPSIQRLHGNVILYRPNGSRETIAKKVDTPKSNGGGGGSPAPQLNIAKISYLQVGAFRDTKSASPLLTKLKQAGFKAIIKGSLDGVARVIVGPVRATDLERIKTNLRAQGLTPFNTTL
jgi:cell division septation protein DedD